MEGMKYYKIFSIHLNEVSNSSSLSYESSTGELNGSSSSSGLNSITGYETSYSSKHGFQAINNIVPSSLSNSSKNKIFKCFIK